METQLLNELPLIAKMIIYVGTPMIVGMSVAVATLWKAKESRDQYIRESDKANVALLTNLGKAFELMHEDIKDLPVDVQEKLAPLFSDIKHSLDIKYANK